jgi:tRNA-2-methylthio-N6-dimethylallyladenosine synthase
MVALINPLLRIRFSTSHPKDMTDEVLETMAKYTNIANHIHLPVQSGNNEMLYRMNRGYTREWFLERVAAIRRILPDCTISTDIITGFCGETDDEHQDTISIMQEARFDFAYMYMYSERPKTLAERKFKDDVPEETKKARLTEIINLQQKNSLKAHKEFVGQTQEVLIEGFSRRSDEHQVGRNQNNIKVVFPKTDLPINSYVQVKIKDCTSATLMGEVVIL